MAVRLVVLCLSAASALRLPTPKPLAGLPKLPAFAAALGLVQAPLAALADDAFLGYASQKEFWIDFNRPPIELNPIHVNPAGYILVTIYVTYIAWSILRPPNEAEAAYAVKVEVQLRTRRTQHRLGSHATRACTAPAGAAAHSSNPALPRIPCHACLHRPCSAAAHSSTQHCLGSHATSACTAMPPLPRPPALP